jgi:hypothetical protein
MRESFWNKKIPTILGILIIVIGVGITTFLANQSTLFKSNASLSNQPNDVRITNITDTSFTVSYSTNTQVPGSLNYGKDQNLGQSALDDRDQQSGNLANYNIHNITVQRLSQQTQYFFTITSGQDSYSNNGQPFTVTTGPALANPPSQAPITGNIILPDGTAPSEALVYVTMDGAQVISTLVKSDGSYILPLNSLRTGDNSTYYAFPQDAGVKILAIGNSLSSNASLSFSQIHPVPTITLSKNYDFTTGQSPITVPVSLESFPSFESTASAQSPAPEILTPKENQSFTDQQPLFKGTGLPEQNVDIVIHSDTPVGTSVTTDSNGDWSYRPTTPLTPGNHTIAITTKNASGILQTITQSFVVYAAGQQTNPPAPSVTPTPSVILTPSPTLTPKVTPTVILSPTVTPTVTSAPFKTTTPTISPAQTETKGGIIISPTGKLLPPTGNPSIITVGIVGVIVTLTGGLLFLLSHGGISAL